MKRQHRREEERKVSLNLKCLVIVTYLNGDIIRNHEAFHFYFSPVMEAAKIPPLYSVLILKDDQKGQSEGSGKHLPCILFDKYKAQRGRGSTVYR